MHDQQHIKISKLIIQDFYCTLHCAASSVLGEFEPNVTVASVSYPDCHICNCALKSVILANIFKVATSLSKQMTGEFVALHCCHHFWFSFENHPPSLLTYISKKVLLNNKLDNLNRQQMSIPQRWNLIGHKVVCNLRLSYCSLLADTLVHS